MPRFDKCPQCLSTAVEILDDKWICWDCEWEEVINQDERDSRETGE